MTRTSTAVILLAGMGTRLLPLTQNQHKALIEIGGHCILERQITQLKNHGIKTIHLVLGYREQDIINFITAKNWSNFVTLHHNTDYKNNNTGASLFITLPFLNDSFLLLDGDVMLEDQLLKPLIEDCTECRFLCDTDTSKLNSEAVRILADDAQHIQDISKHVPLNISAGESIGVSLYQKDWIEPLMQTLKTGLASAENHKWYYEDALHVILQSSQKTLSPLHIIPTGNFKWVEIDDHDDLARARKLFGL